MLYDNHVIKLPSRLASLLYRLTIAAFDYLNGMLVHRGLTPSKIVKLS